MLSIKKIICVLGFLFTIACNQNMGFGSARKAEIKTVQLTWIEKWFAAWELVSNDIFKLSPDSLPEMLFFDETLIYTTSKISAPDAPIVKGPKIFGQDLPWRTILHNNKIKLPNGQEVPVGLMTFAAPAKEGNVFFVMASPTFWKKAGIESKELDFEKMLTGVFLHEFAHTRQFQGFGSMIDSIERNHIFKDTELNDDIVQDYFKKDTAYVNIFKAEVDKFYEAFFAESLTDTKRLTSEAITLYKNRQHKYFIKEKIILNDLDNIFLSMEGLGQFVAVSWLIHKEGGNIPFATAVNGFRRKRNQWSQEEGLAMFLILDKLTNPNWNKNVFGKNPMYIIDLLERAVKI